MITVESIKELRDRTGISIAECKKALEAASGDMAAALAALRERGAAIAEKKAGRSLGAGVVSAYVHNTGKVGVLVELCSETDFVAKNTDFKELADDLAMHVAAFNPVDVAELLAQPFVKDPARTVTEMIQAATQKFGERLEVSRFTRFEL